MPRHFHLILSAADSRHFRCRHAIAAIILSLTPCRLASFRRRFAAAAAIFDIFDIFAAADFRHFFARRHFAITPAISPLFFHAISGRAYFAAITPSFITFFADAASPLLLTLRVIAFFAFFIALFSFFFISAWHAIIFLKTLTPCPMLRDAVCTADAACHAAAMPLSANATRHFRLCCPRQPRHAADAIHYARHRHVLILFLCPFSADRRHSMPPRRRHYLCCR